MLLYISEIGEFWCKSGVGREHIRRRDDSLLQTYLPINLSHRSGDQCPSLLEDAKIAMQRKLLGDDKSE